MTVATCEASLEAGQRRLLDTLERLLALPATEFRRALGAVSQVLGEVLGADMVEVFLYDPASETLVATGASTTPMARRQRHIGLDRVPLANGGRIVEVFQTGVSYHTGHADQDPAVPRGVTQGLAARSLIDVPLEVAGDRLGVIEVVSAQVERFAVEDLQFMATVARWVGLIAHRAEPVAQSTRASAAQSQRAATMELITVLAPTLQAALTPLQAQLTLLRTRANREGRPDDLQIATAAELALQRLERVLADALETVRLEHGLFGLRVQPVDLAALTWAAVNRHEALEADLRVQALEELVVMGDPACLGQALETLLTYALLRSPPGAPVMVQLNRETATAEGDLAVLRVQDEGPAISPDLLPTLFMRAGLEAHGDPGLGLYLARAIAEAHGGTLGVEATADRATAFRLVVPLAPLAPTEPMGPRGAAPEEGQRILVVDGEPERCAAVSAYLETRGYLVVLAADGADAQAQVRTALPDLVVLDATTADLDGLATLRELRAVSNVPVIMVSQRGGEDATVQALRLGADDFLTLPVGHRELGARIERALRRGAPSSALPLGALVVDADLTIDFGRNRVILRGTEAALTGPRTPAALPPGEQRGAADALRDAAGTGVGAGVPRGRTLRAALRELPAGQDRARLAAPQVHPDGEGPGLPLRRAGDAAILFWTGQHWLDTPSCIFYRKVARSGGADTRSTMPSYRGRTIKDAGTR